MTRGDHSGVYPASLWKMQITEGEEDIFRQGHRLSDQIVLVFRGCKPHFYSVLVWRSMKLFHIDTY